MANKEDLLNEVLTVQKEIFLLNYATALLGWDQVVNMPSKGIDSRSEQNALLSGIIHDKMTSDKFFNTLKELKKMDNLSHDELLMVDKLLKSLSKTRKLPKDFVIKLSKATSLGHMKWEEARNKNNFDIFKPSLEEIVKLKQKEAKLYGFNGHLYNGLLDDYEEGMTVEKLKTSFTKLKKELILLTKKIENSRTYKNQKKFLLSKNFPKDIQIALSHDVSQRIGLNKDISRTDFSTHPFSVQIGINDVRITTSIRDNPLFCFESTIHEAGHALYCLQMPPKNAYNVLGHEPSMGIHESQSRFWENMISKGKQFWKFYFPIFNERFKLNGDLEQFYNEINFVEPNLIRIESDEVHYCLHIILRFEIELGLIDGSISVKDLPEIWNKKAKEYFNLSPKSYKEGVLQDVHWGDGNFGYFPTYALGTIYASQIYDSLKKDINIEKELEKGDYSKIRDWLGEKIHKKGSILLAEDLIKSVCGEGLNIDVYINYLNKKYNEIYKFN